MNPDHALLLDFVRRGAGGEGRQPVAVDTNLLAHELGCTLIDADPAADTLTLGFEPDARFVQGNASRKAASSPRCSISLDVQFMRAAKAGRFLARAQVRRLGTTLAFASADLLRDGEDAPVASATATLPVFAARPPSP